MTREPTVIYTAASMQQAHLLKNALSEVGIKAVVTNELLERGSGVDAMGWATLPRVMVDAADAPLARQIALDYERRGAVAGPSPADTAESSPAEPSPWPVCPRCGQPRTTRCVICHTTGSDFPRADPDYVWGMGLAEAPDAPACDCGSPRCAAEAGVPEADTQDDGRIEEAEDDAPAQDPLVLRCPTCDEPFVPRFARRCASCGYDFEDGYDADAEPGEPPDEAGSRVLLIAAFLVLVIAAMVAWGIVAY
ncbi:MAG: DUF2007 domain-containing protein [Pirellulales bacterium]|nr:DUF2007 domain-containing protein [Pirellulales bacterium]